MTTVSAIITGHREGLLAGPSIGSFLEAVASARQIGVTIETIAVLDRPDAATLLMFPPETSNWDKVIVSDYGDPAHTRNRGVHEATSPYVTFLDADDLWSHNWIHTSLSYVARCEPKTILHSEVNVVFGDLHQLWFHEDSADELFDQGYLAVGNYWDALTFSKREVYVDIPIRANDLSNGYGHEDWHWNNRTILSGFAHRPVPGTVHFKRRRRWSQSARASDSDVIPWPEDVRHMRRWGKSYPTVTRP